MSAIIFSIGATLCWAVGDYYIQQTSRKIGIYRTFLWLSGSAALVLTPFVYTHIREGLLIRQNQIEITIAAVAGLVAGLCMFDAFRVGKLAVAEPIIAFEITLVAIFSKVIGGDSLTLPQIGLIALSTIGVLLVSTPKFTSVKKLFSEKGAKIAFASLLFMGAYDYFFATVAARSGSLFANWANALGISLLLLPLGIFFKRPANAPRATPLQLVIPLIIIDNAAWICMGFLVLYLPIALAYASTESYVGLAAVIGMLIGREKIRPHQQLGLWLSVISSAIILWTNTHVG